MRAIEKGKYNAFTEKGEQHYQVGNRALEDKAYDAAITNYCVAIINYLDALSVNRFGKDLSSDNHEAAPVILQKQLSGIGISGFKAISADSVRVLRMKNIASYRAQTLNGKQAREARKVVEKVKNFIDENLNSLVI